MPNRTLCDVLGEMRKANETRNYSYLLGLIEEAQHMGNRMESALWDQSDIKQMREEKKNLKQELKDLKQEIEETKKNKRTLTKAEKKSLKQKSKDLLQDRGNTVGGDPVDPVYFTEEQLKEAAEKAASETPNVKPTQPEPNAMKADPCCPNGGYCTYPLGQVYVNNVLVSESVDSCRKCNMTKEQLIAATTPADPFHND